MPVEIVEWFTKEDIRANPTKMYVFGDNEDRVGTGGQAKACRGEPNTIGIRTKRHPKEELTAYWHDTTFVANTFYAFLDFQQVMKYLKVGRVVVFPKDGFGTGLAKLKENAPLTLAFIETMTKFCIDWKE